MSAVLELDGVSKSYGAVAAAQVGDVPVEAEDVMPTPDAADRPAVAPVPPAPAAPGPRAVQPRQSAEAIDLLGTAGAPVLKRLAPVLGALLLLVLVVRRLRR